MTKTLRIWAQAFRPKTLPAAASPVIIGTIMAYAHNAIHLRLAAVTLLTALLIQIGTNLANDYFDYIKGADTANRKGPTRATQAGLIAPSTMKKAFILVFALAFVSGIALMLRGGWPIVLIGAFSLLFGVLYTGGPFPLAYLGLGDIFVLIFFGPVAVGGTYYLQTLSITPEVLLIGLSPGLLSMAILAVNNLRDIDEDRSANKNTLAVRFGPIFAQFEHLFCLTVAAIIPLLVLVQTGQHPYAALTLLLLLPAFSLSNTIFNHKGKILNKALTNTAKLLVVFTVLFSVGWLIS